MHHCRVRQPSRPLRWHVGGAVKIVLRLIRLALRARDPRLLGIGIVLEIPMLLNGVCGREMCFVKAALPGERGKGEGGRPSSTQGSTCRFISLMGSRLPSSNHVTACPGAIVGESRCEPLVLPVQGCVKSSGEVIRERTSLPSRHCQRNCGQRQFCDINTGFLLFLVKLFQPLEV